MLTGLLHWLRPKESKPKLTPTALLDDIVYLEGIEERLVTRFWQVANGINHAKGLATFRTTKTQPVSGLRTVAELHEVIIETGYQLDLLERIYAQLSTSDVTVKERIRKDAVRSVIERHC